MVITGVKQVGADDDLVTDVSHNYKDTKEYVVVSYKVTALSNKVSIDDFDGGELSLFDNKHESSIVSSNRDGNYSTNDLHKGETQDMRIGFGMKHKGSTVTIHFANQTWKGKISQSSADDSSSSSETSTSTSDSASSTQSKPQSKASGQQASETSRLLKVQTVA
jgi:hypothetical protein